MTDLLSGAPWSPSVRDQAQYPFYHIVDCLDKTQEGKFNWKTGNNEDDSPRSVDVVKTGDHGGGQYNRVRALPCLARELSAGSPHMAGAAHR
jgi:hypothetical protein